MQDVEDEPLFCERVAGLDIAKTGVEVTIRVPSDTTAGRRQQETRSFGTTRAELESLGDWLACWGVTRTGMEATGDYWKPAFRAGLASIEAMTTPSARSAAQSGSSGHITAEGPQP
jgi:transposase